MNAAQETLDAWLTRFETALGAGDAAGAANLFGDVCYWRDMLAFTWNIITLEGREAISSMMTATLSGVKPSGWRVDGQPQVVDGAIEAWLNFETAAGPGKGHIRLRDGACWTLLTTLKDLKDHPFKEGAHRSRGVEHGARKGRQHWDQRRRSEAEKIGVSQEPYCLIIGGGQGGMALAARLGHLDVPTLIVEKNARAGDSWRNRYQSLCLHDPVWYDHMPYIPFPEGWPVFTPKEMMGDWLEMYAKVMSLNYWTATTCTEATYDPESARWQVTVNRDGKPHTLKPAHLVFATGMSGYPQIPQFSGRNTFAGKQLHTSAYRTGAPFADLKCVVVGSNTSAHDVCADLWEHGADVTMVQRSGSLVVQTDTCLDRVLGLLYSEAALAAGIDTETADYMSTTWPHRELERRQVANCAVMRERDAELHARLEKAGFILDFGPDDTGLVMKSFREGGGFYINVGASELICNGDIKLKSGVEIEALDETGVRMADGTHLEADVVVYATGYGSMNRFVADIAGQDIADKVGKCWGLGAGTRKDPGPWEGELRNMWKPTQQKGLWFQGGNLMQSRHFSRFLALQIKARMEGMSTPVYGLQPSHHRV